MDTAEGASSQLLLSGKREFWRPEIMSAKLRGAQKNKNPQQVRCDNRLGDNALSPTSNVTGGSTGSNL